MKEHLVIVSRDELLRRIRGEYLEMPGLRLTLAQAQRLWGLDRRTCEQLLESLTEQRFLCHRHDGTYARAADGAGGFPAVQMVKAGRALAAKRPRATGSSRK